jgi:hypothetical protein
MCGFEPAPHPLVPFRPLQDGYRLDRNESGQQKKTSPVSTSGSRLGRSDSDCHRLRSGSPFAIAGAFLGHQTRGVHRTKDLANQLGLEPDFGRLLENERKAVSFSAKRAVCTVAFIPT